MDSSTSIADNSRVLAGDLTLESGDPSARTSRRGAHAIELVLVALAPIVIFYAYRVQPMAPVETIDPTLYTAYINNGPEVLQRFGSDVYYWTRLGMVLPARLSHLAFGAVPGFFVFRFLLALVAVLPAYELFRRLRGRAAGAVAVAVILVNPVILRAWGSDYPNSAAIAYLLGGSACLLMPGASGRGRWLWLMTAAALFTAAIHCNIIITGLVACTVVSYAAVFGARAPRRMLMQIAVMAATGVVVSVVLVVGAKLMFGVGDIIGPNRRAVEDVQEKYNTFFHSANWRWLLRATHLVVIPVVLAAWVLLRGTLRHRSSLCREETVAFLSLLLQAIAFTVWQFAFNGSTLEHYFYFSLLWAGVSFLTAFVLVMMWDLQGSDRRYLATAAVVLLMPWLFHLAGWRPAFTFWPWVPVLLAVFGVSAVAARAMRSRRATGSTAVMFVTAVALVAVCFVLTIGARQRQPLLAGQVAQPDPHYGQVFFNGNDRYVEMYRVASQVPRGVPEADDEPGPLLKWWARGSSELVSMSAAMYLVNGIDIAGLDFDRQRLLDDPPRLVMLLGDSTDGFAEMTEILQDTGFEVEQVLDRTLTEGDATLHQRLLRVTPPENARKAGDQDSEATSG